ncbi:Gfo/Idh/MocA family protein [Arenibaculum pallidiluteum]|uniref:Gfo/Idh/MocA family protein n=1 Tax=Arenibaculum pallidiluteum TaxID=2812559 RepID=UPI002E2DD69F|nr:Gfo/Idh/MocA family oxidoreductase [Arenibaculum pallidiluteum]
MAVAGLGYWGPNLVRNFSASSSYTLVAAADRSESARRAAGANIGRPLRIVEDAEELIRSPDIDAIAIATPVSTHYKLAAMALDAGKHVLVEKPMCTSSLEAEDLTARARRAGRALMVDHTYLFTGAVQAIKSTISSGQLGKICYIDGMRVNLGLFQPDVNVLWDLAPHDLAILDHLLGMDPQHVEASGYCHVNPDLPDIVYLTMYFGQAVCHLNLSWMSPVKVRRMVIGGNERMLVWDDLNPDEKLKVYNSGISFQPPSERSIIVPDYRTGDVFSPRLPRHEPLAAAVEHFARVIRGEEQPIMGADMGLRVVRTLERAQQALDASLRRVAAAQ